MTTLISFLGKGQYNPEKGYRPARYRFPDGSVQETPYFGLALARHLNAERLVLLGTNSSMWDVLIENVAAGDDQGLRLELMRAVAENRVDDALLARVAPWVEQAMGRPVSLIVIPHARDLGEQTEILDRVAQQVHRSARVAIDVTHGYRHLAMIGQTAARYLRATHNLKLDGLWYGALDMIALSEDGTAPVLRLDGLDVIQSGVEAFARHEASGDFSVFAPLLLEGGLSEAECAPLGRAWAMVQTTNVNDAAAALRPLLQRLRQPLTGPAELFREKLLKELRWVEAPTLAEQQRLLALQALKRGDFLRASIFGLESFLSKETANAGNNPLRREHRENAKAVFENQLDKNDLPKWKKTAYSQLRMVRNACAHGTPPRGRKEIDLLRDIPRLSKELDATLNRLTNT